MVSVIIPNYNHALFLQQRIETVLNQTYQNFEVIILDDCSTDNSRDIIEEYRNHEKVSQVIYNTKNSGSTFKQWNKGVDLANGKYIWIAESDDVAEVSFLETLVKKLDDNPNANISFCQSYRLSANGEITGDWKNWADDIDKEQKFGADFYLDGKQFIEQFLVYKNVLPNASAVLFKKNVFENAGKANEHIKYCSDWFLWLKMLTTGMISYTATSLNYFRYHEKSVIAQAINKKQFYLPYDIKMRRSFNRFLIRSRNKELSVIKALNTKLVSSEASTSANYMLSVKQFLQAFYFLQMAVWHSVKPGRRKFIGLFIHNFFKAFRYTKYREQVIKK